MIKLGKAGARERLEFGGGAFLVYRTATTIDHEAGTQAARAFFRAVRAGKDSLESFGLVATPIAAIDLDDALAFGVSEVVSLTEIALRCVTEWGGIGDEDGAALPLNRANLCALLQDARYFQPCATRCLRRCMCWPPRETHPRPRRMAKRRGRRLLRKLPRRRPPLRQRTPRPRRQALP